MTPHYVDIPNFELVVIGAAGDLATRKIFPALFAHHVSGHLPKGARIIAVSRQRGVAPSANNLWQQIAPYVRCAEASGEFESFYRRITFVQADATKADGAETIVAALSPDEELRRVYYLATAPQIFGEICRVLQAAAGVHNSTAVVLEKPLGHDLRSSRVINDAVGEVFDEHQIFRIDHYLGKETVQNLIVVALLPAWLRCAQSIDHATLDRCGRHQGVVGDLIDPGFD